MTMIKTIRQTITGIVEHFRRFPEFYAAALKARRQQVVLIDQEVERLDRIRNPSKYRLK